MKVYGKYLLDDVGVLQVFEEGDLSDGRTGHTIVFFLEPDFLDGHNLVGLGVLRLVDNTIGSLTQLLEPLVLIEVPNRVSKSLFLLYRLRRRLHCESYQFG